MKYKNNDLNKNDKVIAHSSDIIENKILLVIKDKGLYSVDIDDLMSEELTIQDDLSVVKVPKIKAVDQ